MARLNKNDTPYSAHRDGFFVSVPEMDQLCATLKDKFCRLSDTNEYLTEQLENLKKDTFKDEELSKMKAELEALKADYYRGFPISKKEKESIDKWMNEHEKIHKGGHGTIGGKYTYVFNPTSIGTIGTIKCSCGECFEFQNDL